MIIVQGVVRVRAEDVERVRSTASWFVRAAREDSGCIYYAITQDVLDPTLVHVAERWVDEESYAEHMATPHAVRLGEFIRTLHMSDLELTSYTATGENLLMGG